MYFKDLFLLHFRAQKFGYITQEQIEYADPVMMIGLPRLAVLW